MKTLALILAGGRGSRLDILSKHRAKPSVPFGGKYRIIDFALSNCVNSHIYNVGVLTQYLPRSLNEHIGIGKAWDLDRQFGGVNILHPYTGRKGGWYQGTAHAVFRNLNYIEEIDSEYVIILSGDHIYKMDYAKLIDFHKAKEAELTIAVKKVPKSEAHQFGILDVNKDMRIIDFKEKPKEPPSDLASMGIYVFNKEVLVNKLKEFCTQENSDFGHHIIPQMIKNNKVFAYEFNGYWQDVGTVKSFWETNLALINSKAGIDLNDKSWPWHTNSITRSPARFGSSSKVKQSLICNGAVINGEVENSVISSGVRVEKGAFIKDSIIFNDTQIKTGAMVCKSIIDKEVVIGKKAKISSCSIQTKNFEQPEVIYGGLNLIGKRAVIPANTLISGNCRIYPEVKERDFNNKFIPSGSTIRPRN